VTIGSVEKYITDTAFAMGWRPDMSKVKPNGKARRDQSVRARRAWAVPTCWCVAA